MKVSTKRMFRLIKLSGLKSIVGALALLLIWENPGFSVEDTPNPNRPIKDKWAVIIGVSKFANPSIPTLKYPAKDASDFCEFLVKKGNFSRDHILLLKDEQASREKILEAFGDGWLPRRVMEDDLVLIYISSHGSPADKAGENFIIAYDSNPEHPYATSIRLQDLASEVKKRTNCDRLVLLLDACHSGAALDGKKGLIRSNTNFDLNTVVGTGDLVISSSKPDEVSWESKRYQNGVFTHNLIEALQVNGAKTKLEDAYKILKDQVQQEVRFDRIASQTPMMLSKWNGTELALCLPAAEPRTLHFSDSVEPETNKPSAITGTTTGATTSTPTSTPTNTNNGTATVKQPASKVPNNREAGLSFMSASWTANNGDVTLERSTRILSPSELEGLSPQRLTILYNEAFARHGRGFATPDIQAYYNGQSWYKQDPDYHWRHDDPVVVSRGTTDDALIINQKRTPKQWENMQIIQRKIKAKASH